MLAGPSVITVVADRDADPDWIAADLIAQAEHDVNSQCILIAKDYKTITKVKNSVSNQIKSLPRKKIAETSLKKNGIFIVEEDRQRTKKKKTIVFQPFGRGVQTAGNIIMDTSGRSFEFNNVISIIIL